MALRPPPGRVGRPWLMRRLAVARTASNVLDETRRALLRVRGRLEDVAHEAQREWESAAAAAAEWLERAAVLSGERQIALARAHRGATAELAVDWRNSLGVLVPAEHRLTIPDTGSAVGGSAALPVAARAHRRALAAGVEYAAARIAYDRTSDELALTTRRLQAIERRWIPRHEEALSALELALDEAEREDATRTRWAVRTLAEQPTRK
jgi:vacuolar-type H+-ATPase subunit D/Vma8